MIREAEEERAKRALDKQEDQPVKTVSKPGFINHTRLIITGAYLLIFYVLPLYLIPNNYSPFETLIITQVK